jgi:hypothetical protein
MFVVFSNLKLQKLTRSFILVVENKREKGTNRPKGYISSLTGDAANFVLIRRVTAN